MIVGLQCAGAPMASSSQMSLLWDAKYQWESQCLPSAEQLLKPQQPSEAMISPATPEHALRLADAIAAADVPIQMSPKLAICVECRGGALFFVPARGIAQAATKTSVAGVLVRRRTFHDEVWAIESSVVTQPVAGTGRVAILVVSTGGHVMLAGQAEIDDATGSFHLSALRQPGAIAIEVQGRVEGAKIRIASVRSDARRNKSLIPDEAVYVDPDPDGLASTAQFTAGTPARE